MSVVRGERGVEPAKKRGGPRLHFGQRLGRGKEVGKGTPSTRGERGTQCVSRKGRGKESSGSTFKLEKEKKKPPQMDQPHGGPGEKKGSAIGPQSGKIFGLRVRWEKRKKRNSTSYSTIPKGGGGKEAAFLGRGTKKEEEGSILSNQNKEEGPAFLKQGKKKETEKKKNLPWTHEQKKRGDVA